MNKKNLRRNDSFIRDGYFLQNLRDNWTLNDSIKVTKGSGLWEGVEVNFMHALNAGQGSQQITLALLPRPTEGRADYKLSFSYEVYGGRNATVRIKPGSGEEIARALTATRKVEPEPLVEPGVLLDLHLSPFAEVLKLDPEEETVTVSFISATKDDPIDWGGLRVTFVRLELLLEPLALQSLTIDGEEKPQPLHLCFGAQNSEAHSVLLNLAPSNLWRETKASLLVEGGGIDPSGFLSAQPAWESEQLIESPWKIHCAPNEKDTQITHSLSVASQYTADLYELPAVSGHFRLDVIAMQEAVYYPVIDLEQSVDLRVRVKSHYMDLSLANREVTWTLKHPEGDVELLKVLSDANGEADYTWTPDTAGDWEVVASVDSYYKKDEALHTFAVRVLKEDPWLGATFKLDHSERGSIWGCADGYPCRGATHEVTVEFPDDHLLAETDLILKWSGDHTPGGLGIGFDPELGATNPIDGPGQTWNMVCDNRRDGHFELSVRCSKLLEASPVQRMELAHNWLSVAGESQSSRFPFVGGPPVKLGVQIQSEVPGVGTVRGGEVRWQIEGEADVLLPTGEDGWCEYQFDPEEEGTVRVVAKVSSPYDSTETHQPFTLEVLGENPWASLATVTLDGKPANPSLICFHDGERAALKIVPVGGTLIGDKIWVEVISGSEVDLAFESEPPLGTALELPEAGLIWNVWSNASASTRFTLIVHHDKLPEFPLAGLLLPRTLEGEGTLRFDEKALTAGSTAYPCLHAEHTWSFTPKPFSPLLALGLAAKWTSYTLGMVLDPVAEEERELISGGLNWKLDCLNSPAAGETALSLSFAQIPFVYPLWPLVLGHNRLVKVRVREPVFDLEVGQTIDLWIQVHSFYTNSAVQDVPVAFEHDDTSVPVLTDDEGWAIYEFTATTPGETLVTATVPSHYDGPGAFPSHTFKVTVVAAHSTKPTQEESLMSKDPNPTRVQTVIGDWREPIFDPVVGDSIYIEVQAVSSNVRIAAAGVPVKFSTGERQSKEVVTDDQGWARYAYNAEHVGNIVVTATLDDDRDQEAPPLSFRFKVLAAGVWDAARIQLNAEPTSSVWGTDTAFPRTTSLSHTVKLLVPDVDSPLLGREISLGWKGDSSASELGITKVEPAFGVARVLTQQGLSWTFTGGDGGAYGLILLAAGIRNHSPVNRMSFGETPLPELLPGSLPGGDGSESPGANPIKG